MDGAVSLYFALQILFLIADRWDDITSFFVLL